MSRTGERNSDRFPSRRDDEGRPLCRVCGEPVPPPKQTFCGPRCLRDFFMVTDWQRVRRVVYERDGGICMKCGKRVPRDDYHVDHIIPLAKGGDEWDLANLELSCPSCNLAKGAKPAKVVVRKSDKTGVSPTPSTQPTRGREMPPPKDRPRHPLGHTGLGSQSAVYPTSEQNHTMVVVNDNASGAWTRCIGERLEYVGPGANHLQAVVRVPGEKRDITLPACWLDFEVSP